MWDLVGNPADKFCHDTAHMAKYKGTKCHGLVHLFHYIQLVERNEPCSEKTGLRGFRPGPTQIGLYGHRRWLEA